MATQTFRLNWTLENEHTDTEAWVADIDDAVKPGITAVRVFFDDQDPAALGWVLRIERRDADSPWEGEDIILDANDPADSDAACLEAEQTICVAR